MMAVHMKPSQYGRRKKDVKWMIGKKLFELKTYSLVLVIFYAVVSLEHSFSILVIS